MIVIGLDPGGTTGLFTAFVDGNVVQKVDHQELKSIEDVGDCIKYLLSLGEETLVGCERYIITASRAKTNQPDALFNTGVLMYLCAKARVPVHLVVKANAMKIASNERLRTVGWWKRGDTHSNDAARCALAATAAFAPGVFRGLPGVVQL